MSEGKVTLKVGDQIRVKGHVKIMTIVRIVPMSGEVFYDLGLARLYGHSEVEPARISKVELLRATLERK